MFFRFIIFFSMCVSYCFLSPSRYFCLRSVKISCLFQGSIFDLFDIISRWTNAALFTSRARILTQSIETLQKCFIVLLQRLHHRRSKQKRKMNETKKKENWPRKNVFNVSVRHETLSQTLATCGEYFNKCR